MRSAGFLPLGMAVSALLGSVPASAQRAAVAAPIADVVAGAARLDFLPRQSGEGFTLTISGPDGAVEQLLFEPGQPVVFPLSPAGGGSRRDGSYVYELRARRAAAIARPSLSGRETADGRPAEVEEAARSRTMSGDSSLAGAFRVLNGAILAGGSAEPLAARPPAGSSRPAKAGRTALDVVTADDAIVQGSECVGLDCVNNEVFGFHTLRLKENNTRIGFVDTSSSVGFATNDWTLRANDAASGGGNYFAIVDNGASGGDTGSDGGTVLLQVTAGAPVNSLVVDASGRIGLRTATPVLDLHALTSNTPGVRLEQSNAAGFSAQTWDVAANEANFFVRDITGGSRLPFRIRPGAPTSSLDISASGDVGIGTSSPAGTLHVNASAPQMNLYLGQGGVPRWRFVLNGADPDLYLWDQSAGAYRMSFASGSGNVGFGKTAPAFPLEMASGAYVSAGGVWTNASSRAYKRDIQDLGLETAEEALAALRPVTYEYRTAPGEHHVGFIAEDVPEVVATANRKGVSPMDVVGVLTRVVQEQQKTIQELSERLARIEACPR